ncbi:MAG TPA: hypothetical protein VM120_09190, partial [Bryobacteraceae bacterium]|nr:hypothetical protein [Bryobacteraceae bacterium]
IKSEEEKRQEVESAMAALTIPGAPVSILIDHGLSEAIVEKLLTGGVPTVEKLTNVTQEELDAAGVTVEMVEQIQAAVNSFYGQYDNPPVEAPPAEAAQVDLPATAEPVASNIPSESDRIKSAD